MVVVGNFTTVTTASDPDTSIPRSDLFRRASPPAS